MELFPDFFLLLHEPFEGFFFLPRLGSFRSMPNVFADASDEEDGRVGGCALSLLPVSSPTPPSFSPSLFLRLRDGGEMRISRGVSWCNIEKCFRHVLLWAFHAIVYCDETDFMVETSEPFRRSPPPTDYGWRAYVWMRSEMAERAMSLLNFHRKSDFPSGRGASEAHKCRTTLWLYERLMISMRAPKKMAMEEISHP